MTEKNKRPVDGQALEEASQALWGRGAEQPVSAEDLLEATGLMFGAAAPGQLPREMSDEVEDWARTLFG